MVVGPGWSPWSQRYLQPGDLATSPGLRRFMQIQARLKSSGENAAALHRIAVAFHQPVAQHLRAEVWPTIAEAGVLDTFALYVQPNFFAAAGQRAQFGLRPIALARGTVV